VGHTVGHQLIQETVRHVVVREGLPDVQGHLPFDNGGRRGPWEWWGRGWWPWGWWWSWPMVVGGMGLCLWVRRLGVFESRNGGGNNPTHALHPYHITRTRGSRRRGPWTPPCTAVLGRRHDTFNLDGGREGGREDVKAWARRRCRTRITQLGPQRRRGRAYSMWRLVMCGGKGCPRPNNARSTRFSDSDGRRMKAAGGSSCLPALATHPVARTVLSCPVWWSSGSCHGLGCACVWVGRVGG